MPELPEVETIRLKLKSEIVGKEIKEVNVLERKQFIGNLEKIIGKKITDVRRTGKVLNILLDNDTYINIHLKLTGQLLFAENMKYPVFKNIIPFAKTNRMPGKTTRVVMTFSDGSGLFFNDLRKFAWMKISDKPEGPKAVEVISPDFTFSHFEGVVKSSRKPIKILLMDQDKIAGVGNIYANEALFAGQIHPGRKAGSLSAKELDKLYRAVKEVIAKGIKYQGSSAADEAYITPDGNKGRMQDHFLVYQKEGQPCTNKCKGTVKRIKQGGRSSFFCPTCQK
jgi:formamidopyrimidine-DNA glycosylase